MVRPSSELFFPRPASARSSRCAARSTGRWTLRQRAWSSRLTWAGWYVTPSAADHLGPPLAGTALPTKPISLWPQRQQNWQVGHLPGSELGRGTRHWMAPQGLHVVGLCPFAPLADRSRRDPQRGGGGALYPALQLELPGASPPSFAPVEPRLLRSHAASRASVSPSTQRSEMEDMLVVCSTDAPPWKLKGDPSPG
jgi:hypothetical protein